jgi:hypothetical protein
MRRTATLLTALAVVVSCVIVAAQTPQLAGKWTLVPDPSAPGGRGGGFGGGLGMEATVEQNAKTLTITRAGFGGGEPIKSVYNLDGSASKNTMSFQGNSFDQVSTVKADGAKLIISTKSDFGGQAFETTMTLSLDGSGNLIVDSVRPDFQGGGAPITTKLTYKKN